MGVIFDNLTWGYNNPIFSRAVNIFYNAIDRLKTQNTKGVTKHFSVNNNMNNCTIWLTCRTLWVCIIVTNVVCKGTSFLFKHWMSIILLTKDHQFLCPCPPLTICIHCLQTNNIDRLHSFFCMSTKANGTVRSIDPQWQCQHTANIMPDLKGTWIQVAKHGNYHHLVYWE